MKRSGGKRTDGKEMGKRRKEKGERRKEKGERRKEKGWTGIGNFRIFAE